MRLITRQSKANQAAKLWEMQYRHMFDAYPEKLDILKQIESLGINPQPDDIDCVIGNGSWTRTKCYECGEENVDVVEIGEEPDYDTYTTSICLNCLDKAKLLLK